VKSAVLLFLPGSSYIVLLLQLCLVNSSPNKVGQFSFEYCPQSHQTSSAIHHSLALECWLVTPSLLSAFVPCPASAGWEFNSSGRLACHFTPALSACSQPLLLSLRVQLLAPPPFKVGSVLCSTPPPSSVVDYNSLFMFLSFIVGGFNLPRLHWIMFGGGEGVACGVWCSRVGCADLHRQL
jgi:hypothetical protein